LFIADIFRFVLTVSGVKLNMDRFLSPLTATTCSHLAASSPRFCRRRDFRFVALFIAALALCGSIGAQQPATVDSGLSDPDAAQNSLPSAPVPQTAAADQPAQQTKRILGVIPNFRAISADTKLPPQSVKEKFVTATEDSFDYSAIFIPALLAVYSEQTNATPEFGHGGVGYGRYFWHTAVDQTSENYMVEFVVPSLTHEDTRYYTQGRGGFLKRTGYALSRAVVT
jgi:hypothetical protein